MDTHEIKTIYHQGLSFTAKVQEYDVPMDTTDEQSLQFGPSPKRLMLASLAGCTGIDVVSILQKMKVTFSDLRIDVQARLTDEHPKIYNQVLVKYFIRVSPDDQPKMEKAVQLSQEKYCGVSAMFRAFATVTHDITYL